MIRSQAVPLAIPSPSFSRNAASFSLYSQQLLGPVSQGWSSKGHCACARRGKLEEHKTHLFSRMFFSFCLL